MQRRNRGPEISLRDTVERLESESLVAPKNEIQKVIPNSERTPSSPSPT